MIANRLSTKLEKMVREEGEHEPALKALTLIATTFKDHLNHFTHGSDSQLARWSNNEAIAPQHTAGEVIDVLRFIDTVALIACVARERLCQRPVAPFLDRIVEACTPERKKQCSPAPQA